MSPAPFTLIAMRGTPSWGRIIEKVTRKTYEQNIHERIFEPLGMKNSGYERHCDVIKKRASGYKYGPFGCENADFVNMESSPGAGGAIYSTVEDMFLWDRALYTDQLLNKKYRELMFTPNRDVPEVKAAGGRPRSDYGWICPGFFSYPAGKYG